MLNKKNNKWTVFLVLIFIFRLLYGLSMEFWFEDELQIYLIGLKFYTTKLWPYFGPDVVYSHTQIPGALQGLLAGLPFFALPIPESPYIFLNILSFSSLLLLSFYISKQIPSIPKWIIYIWILTCPWTLNLSTHVLNPSYLILPSVLFFVSFFELLPLTRLKVVNKPLAYFILGSSLAFVFQLHMSWVLLIPLIVYVIYKDRRSAANISMLFMGFMAIFILAIPTLAIYGLGEGNKSLTANVILNHKNMLAVLDVLFRYLSFASFELSRFMGPDTATRVSFIKGHMYMSPFFVFCGLVGLLQILLMILGFFKKKLNDTKWVFVKYLNLAIVVLIYMSFVFSIKGPSSHTFYIMFPFAIFYGFYSLEHVLVGAKYKKLIAIFIISGLLVSMTISFNSFKNRSMYAKINGTTGRDVVAKAIADKDYKVLGKLRSDP